MRKSLLTLIAIAVAIVSITSCKKAPIQQNNNQTNNPSNPSNPSNPGNPVLLSKFIELDTTLSAPNDTLDIMEFSYDNQNRLISETENVFSNAVSTGPSVAHLYYNGSDTLPYKEIGIDSAYVNPSVDNDTIYYSYNSSTGVFSDSICETVTGSGAGRFVESHSIIYNGAKVIENATYYVPLASPSTDTVIQTIVNGNVTTQIENTPFNTENYYSYSFDTHPNPFFKNKTQGGIYDIEGWGAQEQKNNYTEVNELNSGRVLYHVKNQFTYLSNGYPSTVIAYYNGVAFEFKGIYIYK